MLRRQFLSGVGVAVSANALAGCATSAASSVSKSGSVTSGDWKALRALFPLTRDYIQLSTFLLASHPKPVADAIEHHRRKFDENPSDYWHEHFETIDGEIAASAARYMGGEFQQYALTDSTTMGLAMVYTGLNLKPGEEILQTVHDHYATDMSLAHSAERTGAKIKRIALYDDPAMFSVADAVQRLKNSITTKTRVVAVTWVHSSTGVKLPIRDLADVIDAANANRTLEDRIIFCVDGVHGLGIENQDVSKLGCDFFIGGTHKWIFGPRGTGVIWGKDEAWRRCSPVIPSFGPSYLVWLEQASLDQVPVGMHMTPGGFHSFEHRWALPKAFELHLELGKANVQKRIHQLNTQAKEGLAKMAHVKSYTPMSSALSSGLTCFDVDGVGADEVVHRMHDKNIIMSSTPYRDSYARFAPSLLNNEQEIDQALAEIHAMG